MEDESFSSWFFRLAYSNGLSPSQLSRQLLGSDGLLRRNIDHEPAPELLAALATRSGQDISKLKKLPFPCDSIAHSFGLPAQLPDFAYLDIRDVAGEGGVRGLPYCPECLKDDQDPYFRKSWQLSFVTICAKHNRPLVDSCPSCEKPFNFAGANNSAGIGAYKTHLTMCLHCGADIRRSNPHRSLQILVEHVAGIQTRFHEAIKDGWFLIEDKPIHVVPWLAGIGVLVTLLTSFSTLPIRFRQNISRAHPIFMGIYSDRLTSAVREIDGRRSRSSVSVKNAFERQSIEVRMRAMIIISGLLERWPGHVQNFANIGFGVEESEKNLLLKNAPFWIFEALFPALLNHHTRPDRRALQDVKDAVASRGRVLTSTKEILGAIQNGTPSDKFVRRSNRTLNTIRGLMPFIRWSYKNRQESE